MPLIKTWDGKNFYAARADADENGDNILQTYAKKTDIPAEMNVSVSYDALTEEIHLDFSSPSPVPPEPTIDYEILQNFVQGQAIGEPAQDGDPWITQVLSEEEYENNVLAYTLEHLVSTSVGSTLIDDRLPLDFSAYGVSSGTPYGMSTNDTDNSVCMVKFNLSNGLYPLTFETFAFARSTEYYGDLNCYSSYGPVRIMTIGDVGNATNPKTNISLEANTSENKVYLSIGGGLVPYDTQIFVTIDCSADEDLHVDTQGDDMDLSYWLVGWHHYAIAIDDSNLRLFLDGKLKGTVALSTQCDFDVQKYNGSDFVVEHRSGTLKDMLDGMDSVVFVKGSNDNADAFDGAYAQLAVCNQCKWTADFSVPDTAYQVNH